MTTTRRTVGGWAVLTVALACASPGAAQTYPARSDYVCTAKTDAGEADDQRVRVDTEAKAWCTSKDDCKEIKTLFGVRDSKVVLESSQLEVTSYESSIDRATGAYESTVTTGGLESWSRGTCKPAPFTPFGVKLDGSRIKGG